MSAVNGLRPITSIWRRALARVELTVLRFLRDTENPLSPNHPKKVRRINDLERSLR
jgi:hypothetical protein